MFDKKKIRQIKVNVKDGQIFNPDTLKLTKSQIIAWVDSCINDEDGLKYKAFVNFIIVSLRTQNQEDLNKLFSRLTRLTNELMIENSIAHMKGEKEEYQETLFKMFELRKKRNE